MLCTVPHQHPAPAGVPVNRDSGGEQERVIFAKCAVSSGTPSTAYCQLLPAVGCLLPRVLWCCNTALQHLYCTQQTHKRARREAPYRMLIRPQSSQLFSRIGQGDPR